MTFNALPGVLGIPAFAAALLAALPNYRVTARLNVAATTLTLICALSLFFTKPQPGAYLLVDDLNGTFIVLTTFVGFTTSIFSASYIGRELEIGRLTPPFVRFYHAMYQVLMFAMNLALVANNIGLMWVAIELATLTTVMMVTRRNAVSQVVGFMSLENGLVLAATGAKGMPLVVEISIAFSILIAFIVIGIFLFRIRERFDSVDMQALDRYRGERQ